MFQVSDNERVKRKLGSVRICFQYSSYRNAFRSLSHAFSRILSLAHAYVPRRTINIDYVLIYFRVHEDRAWTTRCSRAIVSIRGFSESVCVQILGIRNFGDLWRIESLGFGDLGNLKNLGVWRFKDFGFTNFWGCWEFSRFEILWKLSIWDLGFETRGTFENIYGTQRIFRIF